MKRFFLPCVLLLILLFSSCSLLSPRGVGESAPAAENSETAAPEELEPLSPGLYELFRFDNNGKGENFSSMAVHGGEAVVYASRYDPAAKDGNGEDFLVFIDMATGKVSDRVVLEPWHDPEPRPETEPDPWSEAPALYFSHLAIGENGTLVLYNPYEKWAALYDRDGRLQDMIPYGPVNEPSRYDGNYPLLPRYSYTEEGFGFSSFPGSGEQTISALSFADDPDAVWLFESDYESVAGSRGREIACIRYGENSEPMSCRVFDFDEKTVRATVTLPAIFDEGNVSYTSRAFHLGDGYALLAVQAVQYFDDPVEAPPMDESPESESSPESETEIGSGEAQSGCVEVFYLWRFDGESEGPLDASRETAFSLYQKNKALKDEFLKEYEITLHLDEAPPADYTPWDDSNPEEDAVPNKCVTGVSELEQYRLLLALGRFLRKLPAGFTREMYTGYPYGSVNHESFDIYIVKEIPGSAAAFASGFTAEQFLICFATDEFSESHLPHEFMHLIEVRIHDLRDEKGRSLWDEWDSLNPEGYSYGEDDYRPEYFVTWYATTDQMEDRADVFMTMWEQAEASSGEDPYADAPGVRAKMKVLTDAIREAYPSVEAIEKAFWES